MPKLKSTSSVQVEERTIGDVRIVTKSWWSLVSSGMFIADGKYESRGMPVLYPRPAWVLERGVPGYQHVPKMAASSSGKVSPILLRITYDELVAYADELERNKEKKYSKKRNQENSKENNPKTTNQVDESSSTDVSDSLKSQKKNKLSKDSERKKTKKSEEKLKKSRNSESRQRRKSESGSEEVSVVYSSNNAVPTDKRGRPKPNKKKHKNCFGEQDELHSSGASHEEYDLDLRARTGGVLKPSDSSRKVSEDSNESCSQPRGIIKLPEGISFNNEPEEKELVNGNEIVEKGIVNESCQGRIFHSSDDLENAIGQRQDKQNHLRIKEGDLRASKTMLKDENPDSVGKTGPADAGTESCLGNQNTENTFEDNKVESTGNTHAKVEKKIKSLNLQKAQRLLKMVKQKEGSLNNLLSRDMLDKAAFEKICSLSKEIQEAYKGIMMLDLSFAIQQEVDQNLWRHGFYNIIETLRKYGKLFLGYADALSTQEISNGLKEFLANAEMFYKNLLDLLQKGHELSIQDVVTHPRKAENFGKKVTSLSLGINALFCIAALIGLSVKQVKLKIEEVKFEEFEMLKF